MGVGVGGGKVVVVNWDFRTSVGKCEKLNRKCNNSSNNKAGMFLWPFQMNQKQKRNPYVYITVPGIDEIVIVLSLE